MDDLAGPMSCDATGCLSVTCSDTFSSPEPEADGLERSGPAEEGEIVAGPTVIWTGPQEGGRGADAEIYYASNGDKGWSDPENLSNTAATSLFPTLSQDAAGMLHLAWSDEVDGDFDVYSRTGEWVGGGWTWADRENLSNTDQASRGITQVEYLATYGAVVCWLEGDAAPLTLQCRSGFSEVRFEDAAASAGFTSTARARGAAWADIDGDKLEDLVVLAWSGESLVHHNRGDKTFEVLQDLGDWAHGTFGHSVFVETLSRAMDQHIGYCCDGVIRPSIGYVVPDVRLEHEAQWIRDQGGLMIHLSGPRRSDAPQSGKDHKTEKGIKFVAGKDVLVCNDGTLRELSMKLRGALAAAREVA